MAKRTILPVDFARLIGIKPGTLSEWLGRHINRGALDGGRVVIDHPRVVAYTKKHTGKTYDELQPSTVGAAPITSAKRRSASGETATVTLHDTVEIAELDALTLREITELFGTTLAFKDWLDARKKLVEIREKDLKNGELAGSLISRDLVASHVMGYIDASQRRLLTDASKTIAQTLYPMARRGDSLETGEATVRSILGQMLKPAKIHAAKVLRERPRD